MESHPFKTKEGPVILFDGVCNLCNSWVQFVIRRDSQVRFRFASLQSPVGSSLRTSCGIPQNSDSIVLVEEQRCFHQSSAVLRICKGLDGFWKWLYIFILIPKPLRDWVYRWVARNRYRFFGKRDACMIPTKNMRSRFLDEG
ncbi:thiol-disulfide oxidoreductase DCC family protein [Kroppenstedtia pulmonis]|uniref:Thiol-disulfide oxidoreductase DCC family protein n=1 Tax=Kroppenstedtia pulmonis TaxID=1380685 RepID=A0A7D4CWT3_9BACL|nr:thiol-disulfide oxidoreductase DCC family protein [Kroppenstedtia pulmonis]QKG85297.1 thiol-disulfide oxidoreductase DCC family protein [Kroppenstedtia pulmonis]